jgi:hypothetical protein
MKTLIAALTLVALTAVATAYVSVSERRDAAGQTYRGSGQGYPVSEWNRPANW